MRSTFKIYPTTCRRTGGEGALYYFKEEAER